MPNNLLLINCLLLAHVADRQLSYLLVRNGKIAAIGPMAACPLPGGMATVDGGGNLVLPGLINGHNHCAMTLFRGMADDLALSDWLYNHIFPAEAALVNPEMVYWCTLLAAAEMISSGTTSVADGYFFSATAAEALRDAGMRAVIAHGIVDFPAPSVPDPSKNIETVEGFLRHWQGRSSLITPAVFAHAPYTCSPRTLRRAKELADRYGTKLFIHVAETANEQATIIEPQGPTPLQHLANLGILDAHTVLVHGVWLDGADLDILAASGAAVVTCPQSNLKLGAGIAPIPPMLSRHIPVGLGTDGCASNNSLDLFREMDMLAKLHKATARDATAMPASRALSCATEGGASVLGLAGCGTISEGAAADLILVAIDQPHLTPFANSDLLVYAASGADVRSVIIDGRPVMRDRHIVSFDVAATVQRVCAMAARSKHSDHRRPKTEH